MNDLPVRCLRSVTPRSFVPLIPLSPLISLKPPACGRYLKAFSFFLSLSLFFLSFSFWVPIRFQVWSRLLLLPDEILTYSGLPKEAKATLAFELAAWPKPLGIWRGGRLGCTWNYERDHCLTPGSFPSQISPHNPIFVKMDLAKKFAFTSASVSQLADGKLVKIGGVFTF